MNFKGKRKKKEGEQDGRERARNGLSDVVFVSLNYT